MGMMRLFFVCCSENQRLAQLLPHYAFVRKAVSRFIPGEDQESALTQVKVFKKNGITAIITYLGEHVTEEAEATRVTDQYREVLNIIYSWELDCQLSVKLSQLGPGLDSEQVVSNLESLVSFASNLGNFIWIDMESSDFVNSTVDIFRRIRSKYSNIGICLQSYLYRTSGDLEGLFQFSPVIRLVKGAYAEPRNIAYQKKKVVDSNFMNLALKLLDQTRREGIRSAFATHDLKLIHQIKEKAKSMGINKKKFEFQMLYGIRRNYQIQLKREGYQIRVLVNYGAAWFPWYMRRLAEHPPNLFFVLKSLLF